MPVRRVLLSCLSLVAAGFVALSLPAPQARADVAVSQQVVALQDKGPFKLRYTQWHNQKGKCSCARAFSGTFNYSMISYRLKEQVKKYDYYLVDVSGTTSDRTHYDSGQNFEDVGVIGIAIGTRTPYNFAKATEDAKATKQECSTYDLSLGVSSGTIPGIDASATVAHFTSCGPKFSLTSDEKDDGHITFTGRNMNMSRTLSAQRWIRVKAGQHPDFLVKMYWDVQTCGEVGAGGCKEFVSHVQSSKLYKVPTHS